MIEMADMIRAAILHPDDSKAAPFFDFDGAVTFLRTGSTDQASFLAAFQVLANNLPRVAGMTDGYVVMQTIARLIRHGLIREGGR